MIPTISREQLEHEARAKIFWGEEADSVLKYLRMNGISLEEADAIVDSLIAERHSALRASGIKKILFGAGFVCVPVVTWFGFQSAGVVSLKILGIVVVIGLWGAWLILKGILMIAFPESETVDLADDSN
jgi:hypothetical protein